MKKANTLKTLLTCFLFSAYFFGATAQPKLKSYIGLGKKPKDTDSICKMQTYLGSFATSGLQVADTINGFKLYSVTGDSLDIATELSKGKPVLLVAGSYTCPVYRGKIALVNSVATTYTGKVSVFIIYIVEPHPVTPDKSPYSGNVWTTSQNYTDNVLYLQPKTYLDKKNIVQAMLNKMTVNVPVFLDGPCNKWWDTFGPAPNNAYLIRPDGVIYSKHDWFDNKNPHDIIPEINALLNILSVNELPNDFDVKVFPNPTEGVTTFHLKNNSKELSLVVSNILGGEMETHHFNGESFLLNTSHLAKGVYSYKIADANNSVVSGKIVVQ